MRVVGAAMLMHFPVLLTAPAFLVTDRALSLLNYLAQANPSKFINFCCNRSNCVVWQMLIFPLFGNPQVMLTPFIKCPNSSLVGNAFSVPERETVREAAFAAISNERKPILLL